MVPVLNFSLDSAGSLKSYSATAPYPNGLNIFRQENLPGDNVSGSGTAMAIITEQLSHYVAGSWINIQGDSAWACCKHFGYPVMKYRIGQDIQQRSISISPLVRNPVNWKCRVLITWNDIENGRHVIKASAGLFDVAKVYSDGLQPGEFTLRQNYPNPFNPSTKISFSILKAGVVSLKIYDVLGNEQKTLFSGYLKDGEYSVNLAAEDLNSGVYFYRLSSGNYSVTRKMMVIK